MHQSVTTRKRVMWEIARENKLKRSMTTPVVTQREGTLPRVSIAKGHIVIPYMQGLGRALKIYARGMASRPTSKGIELLRIYWSNQRPKIN